MATYEIEVLRIETRTMTIKVEAESLSAAHDMAIDEAGNRDFRNEGACAYVEYHTDLTAPSQLPPVVGE